MSEYTLTDFDETLSAVGVQPADVETVIAAWGFSAEGYGSWEGAFLVRLKDGRYAYAWGWCDTSGWGCRDGGSVEYTDVDPGRTIKRGLPQWFNGYVEAVFGTDAAHWEHDWDEEPADLNRWLAAGAPDRYSFS